MSEDINELFALANSLNKEEKKLLSVLGKAGPSLPAELAVRSFSLPEEINEVLRSLKDKELIISERSPSLGTGEMVYLSGRGRMMANVLLKMK